MLNRNGGAPADTNIAFLVSFGCDQLYVYSTTVVAHPRCRPPAVILRC